MFFNKSSNKKSVELQLEIMSLEERKLLLEEQKAVLVQSIEALKQEQTTSMTKAVEYFQFAIDFEKMNAFSVERIVKDNKPPHTIVGYFLQHPNGTTEVKEWVLYTSVKEHNRLVAEFELWKGQQK